MECHISFSTCTASSGGVAETETLLGEGVPSGSQESIGSHAIVFNEEINAGSSSSSGVLSVSTDRQRNLLHERMANFYLKPCRMDAIIKGYTLKGYGANSIRILLYSSSSCCFRARFMSGKKLFANQLVEGLGTIFGWVHIFNRRTFWPKGKKYILKNIFFNLCFL